MRGTNTHEETVKRVYYFTRELNELPSTFLETTVNNRWPGLSDSCREFSSEIDFDPQKVIRSTVSDESTQTAKIDSNVCSQVKISR